MADIDDLERRVSALEAVQNDTTQTLRWVVTKLGQVAAVQQEHTLRFDRLEGDMKQVKADLKGLRDDLSGIVGDAVREAMRDRN
ncbi:MAG: hypothetical protein ACLFPA_08360 [Dichotomicrobium sp.]